MGTSLPIVGLGGSVAVRPMIAEKLLSFVDGDCNRVLIINPPQIPEEDFLLERALTNRYWTYPPYGPGVLCRNLEMRGYATALLDLNFEILRAAHEKKEAFDYKIWREKLSAILEDFRPDMIGISCMFTMTHSIMKQISEALKEYDPEMLVIAGGVHPSNATQLILEDCAAIDFIGLYECDHSFPDMLDFLNRKSDEGSLRQLATLIEGKYAEIRERVRPEEAAIQVSPLYHDLPIGEYDALGQIGSYGFLRKGRKASSLLRARGCRAHCSFCSVASFNGAGVRERNYLNVVDEIEELIRLYGIKHITFLDDDLLSDFRDVTLFFNEIVKRKLDITWDASNGLIAAAITPELMDAMVASGCIGFNLGIESGNPEILRAVHKPGTVQSFIKCAELVSKYPHVFVKGFLMIGFPDETLSMMLDTVNLSIKLGFPWYPIQVLNPLPSTEIYGKMVERGLIKDSLETSNEAYVFGPHGKQRLVEERQKLTAADFFDLFQTCAMDEVPERNTLGDMWFLVDYKLNYEKILGIENPVELGNIRLMLDDVCNRIASGNAMAWLFLGLLDQKLGDNVSARSVIPIVREIVDGSAFWQKRFEALGLYQLLQQLDNDTVHA